LLVDGHCDDGDTVRESIQQRAKVVSRHADDPMRGRERLRLPA
jgi:hypothetical protein